MRALWRCYAAGLAALWVAWLLPAAAVAAIDFEQYHQRYAEEIRAAISHCDMNRFDGALQKFKALADIAQRRATEALRAERNRLRERGFTDEVIEQQLNLQRTSGMEGRETTNYGAWYTWAVLLNKEIEDWKRRRWDYCHLVHPLEGYLHIRGFPHLEKAVWELWERGSTSTEETPSFFVGVEGVANFNSLSIRERDAMSGVTTNGFSESSSAGGGGFIIGANTNIFLPNNASVRERIVLSFDFFNQNTSHVFPTTPATLIGATSKLITGEVHLGVNVVPGVQIYGIGGFTVLNQDLNINFGGPFVTMQNNTTIGPTYGAGLSFQLPGSPITSFVQWEQTPFATASLPRPPASSSFNYDFTNTMNRLKAGVLFNLSR